MRENETRGSRWSLFRWRTLRWSMLLGLTAWSALGAAQGPADHAQPTSLQSSRDSMRDPLTDSVRELQQQVRELQAAVAGMRSDWQQARAETAELHRELDEVRAARGLRNAALITVAATTPETINSEAEALRNFFRNNPPASPAQNSNAGVEIQQDDQKKHAATLDEEYQLLSGKVDDQYQTKVESASKYRMRLSGIVLMNLASNQGQVDSIDLPTIALARTPGESGGSFGATLRQSEIGFEAFGPTLAGARTKADLQLDLAGGFPPVPNGISSGLARLRTATLRMDWSDTSVVVGQDSIFFSPGSPTSFATLAIPSLTYAGNLWSWVPQIRIEHRVTLGEESSLLFQAGILDPLSGETPGTQSGTSYYRQPGPGEASRQPAYGTRAAWTHNIFGQPLRLGVGGYYTRQNYGLNRNVDGWAGMTDVELPLNHELSLSGKFYRGRAVGGLYGAFGQSVLFSGDPTSPYTEVRALDSTGGWAQLKYRPANKWEFNAAFGMDNPFADDLRYFPYAVSYGNPSLAKNQGSLVNFIYRPRSDLLFSAEYRRLKTFSLGDGSDTAGHVNLMMGVLF
jgi:hypothetical protein